MLSQVFVISGSPAIYFYQNILVIGCEVFSLFGNLNNHHQPFVLFLIIFYKVHSITWVSSLMCLTLRQHVLHGVIDISKLPFIDQIRIYDYLPVSRHIKL